MAYCFRAIEGIGKVYGSGGEIYNEGLIGGFFVIVVDGECSREIGEGGRGSCDEKLALAPGVMVKGVVTPARAKEDPDIVTELIVRS